jgi:16S rRNA processing protein RimM
LREPDAGDPAWLALGVVGRPHGVRGEVVFHGFNPEGARLEELELPLSVELRRESSTRTATVSGARPFKDGSLLIFDGIDTREAAAAITGYRLWVLRAVLPPLAEDESYTADLIGCALFDLEGKPRGRVTAVFWNGSHDVLTAVDEAGTELLIPAVPEFLVSIDVAGRRIVVDPHE